MKGILSLVLFAVVVTSASARDPAAPDRITLISHLPSGDRVHSLGWTFFIEAARVDRIAHFEESEIMEMVTLADAVRIGRGDLERRYPGVRSLELTAVTFSSLYAERRRLWSYCVEYSGIPESMSDPVSLLSYVAADGAPLIAEEESKAEEGGEPGATDNPDDAQRLREDH